MTSQTTRAEFSGFALVLLFVIIITLLPFFVALFSDPTSLSTRLIIHGFLYFGWYLLFWYQTCLVAGRNLARHRRFGQLSVGLFILLLVSGFQMLEVTRGSYSPDWEPGFLVSRTSFVAAISHTILFFGCFYALALLKRKDGAAHKRFMVLASLTMVAASITRVAYLPFVPLDGTLLTLLVTWGFLIAPLVIDRRRHGKVHPVLKYGTVLYVLTQLAVMAILPGLEPVQKLAFGL